MKYVIKQTEYFSKWLTSLKDFKAKARIVARLEAAMNGNFGDHKPIRDEKVKGLYEMRIDFGPGYRVYYGQAGRIVFLVIAGGLKRSQKRDITIALSLWEAIKGEGDDQ